MQEFPMTDGSLIVLVVGHVKTPCGRVIQRRYRDLRTREYYRRAGSAADTTGREPCRTAGGRTVYGGGGIYPDVVLDEPPAPPAWGDLLGEDQLLVRWVGSYLTEPVFLPSTAADLAAAEIPPAVVQHFLAFARGSGVSLPPEAAESAGLREVLRREIAWARWGTGGYYTVAALRDGDVQAAVRHLDRAAAPPSR
jgi:carboxyl-terminal processing protease